MYPKHSPSRACTLNTTRCGQAWPDKCNKTSAGINQRRHEHRAAQTATPAPTVSQTPTRTPFRLLEERGAVGVPASLCPDTYATITGTLVVGTGGVSRPPLATTTGNASYNSKRSRGNGKGKKRAFNEKNKLKLEQRITNVWTSRRVAPIAEESAKGRQHEYTSTQERRRRANVMDTLTVVERDLTQPQGRKVLEGGPKSLRAVNC